MRDQPKVKAAFLNALRQHKTAQAAIEAAGVSRTTIYEWRKQDKEFAEAWYDVVEGVTDEMEATATEWAIRGYEERREVLDPHGEVRELKQHKKDPNLLFRLLASRRRETYGSASDAPPPPPEPVKIELIHTSGPPAEPPIEEGEAK